TAIHELVGFETRQKKRTVRFAIAAEEEIGIQPVQPVPSTNSGPPLAGNQLPSAVQVEIRLIDTNDEQEYDEVTLDLKAADDGYHVTEIRD
ncbi:MAG: hypothetical protein ABEI52_06595, partial [Halobacteriaceae archaeon]